MIYGIGVDTASISRIEKSIMREGFLLKLFGEQERELFSAKNLRAQTVAANFAAKEALSKALGTGLGGFLFCEAQILRNTSGAPYFDFSGTLKSELEQKKLKTHISLTHEGDFATAFVILEIE